MEAKHLQLFGIILTLLSIWPISGKVEQCGSILRGEGTLQSHGYPRSYPSNYECDWTFEAGPNDKVELTFTDFDVESHPSCRYDYLEIFANGDSSKHCGRGVNKVVRGGVLTATGSVKLVLKSDASDNFKGFALRYRITEGSDDDGGEISCATEPCKNGADCVDIDVGEVACFCLDGFEGDFCEINVDECASTPCKNGGTCIDGTDSFTCDCPEGFLGDTCGVDVDDCVADPCRNGGTCIDGANSFECACVTGYTGWNCGQEIDECVSGPCQNMGVCEDRIGFYECVCFPGYTGVNCEIPPPTTTAAPTAPAQTTPQPETPPEPPRQNEAPEPERNQPAEPENGNTGHESPEREQPTEKPSGSPVEEPREIANPDPPADQPGRNQEQPEVPGSAVPAMHTTTQPPVMDHSVLDVRTTPSPGVGDNFYPNATDGNPRNTSRQENEFDAGRQSGKVPEEENSNTGLIAGAVVGVTGLLAALTFGIRHWLLKSKTKVQPASEAPFANESVLTTEPIEPQNEMDDNKKLELVDDDFSGLPKTKISGTDCDDTKGEYRAKWLNSEDQVAKELKMSQIVHKPQKKKTKRKISFGKRLKSFKFRRTKKVHLKPTVQENKNNVAQSTRVEQQTLPQFNFEFLKKTSDEIASSKGPRQNLYAPYAQPIRDRRAVATKRLMSVLAKQQAKPSIVPQNIANFRLSPFSNPLLMQPQMFPRNELRISTSPNFNPPNPISVPIVRKPSPLHTQQPQFLQRPEEMFDSRTVLEQNPPEFCSITQSGVTNNSESRLASELSKSQRKSSKKKSKKSKRSKKKLQQLEDSVGYETAKCSSTSPIPQPESVYNDAILQNSNCPSIPQLPSPSTELPYFPPSQLSTLGSKSVGLPPLRDLSGGHNINPFYSANNRLGKTSEFHPPSRLETNWALNLSQTQIPHSPDAISAQYNKQSFTEDSFDRLIDQTNQPNDIIHNIDSFNQKISSAERPNDTLQAMLPPVNTPYSCPSTLSEPPTSTIVPGFSFWR